MSIYKGRNVVVVRPMNEGDAGYNKSDVKVLVRHDNGREEFVFKSEVDAPVPDYFYGGTKVVVLRPAQAGDTNFSTLADGPKVLIKSGTGEEVVLASDVVGYTLPPEHPQYDHPNAEHKKVEANRKPVADRKQTGRSVG